METMSERTPVPRRPAKAIALALVVLALLVAPVCAPLCAAKACSSGAGQEQCHEMAGMGAAGGEQFLAGSKACGAPDFSAVLVKADERSLFLRTVRNDPAPMRLIGAPAKRMGSLAATWEHLSVPRVPLEPSDPLLLTTILRI